MIAQSIQEKISFIIESHERFSADIDKFQNSFFRAVKKIFDKFDTKGGRVEKNGENKALVRKLRKPLLDVIEESTLSKKVNDYIDDFDKIDKLNEKIHNKVNGVSTKRISFKEEKKDIVDQISHGLLNKKSLEANLIIPLRKILRRHANTGVKTADAIAEIRAFIKGNDGANSEIERYINTIAFESIAQYDGAQSQKILESSKRFNGIQIVGSLIDTSDQVCIDMVNGTGEFAPYHLGDGIYKKEDIPKLIEAMRRTHPNRKSYHRWLDTLHEGNYLVSRNHIGCRHAITPVIIPKRLLDN